MTLQATSRSRQLFGAVFRITANCFHRVICGMCYYFFQAIIVASNDPKMSKQGTSGKRKHITLMFSHKEGLKVAKAMENFSTVCDKKKQEDQF